MSVMKDYAKKDYGLKKDRELIAEACGIAAIIFAGALLGAMLGYGLLYT